MQCDKTGSDISYKNYRYLVAGGDNRLVELVKLFKKNGFEVTTLGMEKADIEGVKNYTNIDEAVDNCDVVIGPIPFSKELNILNNIFSDKPVEMDKLFEKIGKDKILLAGAMNKNSKDTAARFNIKYVDYYWDEAYQIMNAIPTAEGTIGILVNETDITIHASNILILGYGRIGKILADYLSAIGANIYAEARKEHDIAWIKSKAIKAVHINEIQNIIGQMDIIINTVPAMILDKELLDFVRKDVLIVDLASMPGGVDFGYAREKGVKTIHALGLPGKIACKTAAIYMYDIIIKLLQNP